EGDDMLTIDNANSTANDPWLYFGAGTPYPAQTVYFNTQQYTTAGFENVRIYTGDGGNNFELFGQMAQNVEIQAGKGGDSIYLRHLDTWSYRNLGGSFLEAYYHLNIVGGEGFDFLSVDDQARVGHNYDYSLSENNIIGHGAASIAFGTPLEHLDADYSGFESV